MKIEILIHANVVVDDDEDIVELKKEIRKELRESMSEFIKTPISSHGNVFNCLEDVEWEEIFEDEGMFDYVSKKYNRKKYDELMEDRE